MSSAGRKTRLINIVLLLAGVFVALGALYYNGGATRGRVKRARQLSERIDAARAETERSGADLAAPAALAVGDPVWHSPWQESASETHIGSPGQDPVQYRIASKIDENGVEQSRMYPVEEEIEPLTFEDLAAVYDEKAREAQKRFRLATRGPIDRYFYLKWESDAKHLGNGLRMLFTSGAIYQQMTEWRERAYETIARAQSLQDLYIASNRNLSQGTAKHTAGSAKTETSQSRMPAPFSSTPFDWMKTIDYSDRFPPIEWEIRNALHQSLAHELRDVELSLWRGDATVGPDGTIHALAPQTEILGCELRLVPALYSASKILVEVENPPEEGSPAFDALLEELQEIRQYQYTMVVVLKDPPEEGSAAADALQANPLFEKSHPWRIYSWDFSTTELLPHVEGLPIAVEILKIGDGPDPWTPREINSSHFIEVEGELIGK